MTLDFTRARALQTIAGALLLPLAVLPLYGLLRSPLTGLAGAATADMASAASSMIWAGGLFAVAVGIITARVLDPTRTEAALARASQRILHVDGRLFAASVAVVGFLLTCAVEIVVFHREPVLIDAIAQLAHARYLAAGSLAAPPDTIGFFRMLQTAPVANGWVSQYPPMHVGLLALGYAVHATWLVGPIMLAVALYFASRACDVLIPGRAAARVAIALAAVSPFLVAHAATYMSHTSAAAFIAVALFAFARSESAASGAATRWTLISGLAIGAAFATRPLTGLTIGVVFAAALMLRRATPWNTRAVSVAGLLIGALPIVLLVAVYNAHFFGSFTRFGYDVALGPNAGLGFGVDPWGNKYGPVQAIAYTSAELAALSLQLFETPAPLAALIAVYLLVERRLDRGAGIVCALALAPLASHMLYWHHGLFMGPRMLNDYAVQWSVAAALAVSGLYRHAPARTALLGQYSPQTFLIGATASALVAAALLAPQRLRSYAATPSRAFAAASAAGANHLVFVHGGWSERVSMQLAARGWRLDDVESAIRQNSTCSVQRVLDGNSTRASLDLIPRATGLPKRIEFPPGNPIRVVDGEPFNASCAAQVAADSSGTIDPSSLLWRSGNNAPLFARDLGPSLNRTLASTDEQASVLMRDAGGQPRLVPYAAGMRLLWKASQ